MTSPANELRTAATLLKKRLADPALTPGPWLSHDHGDRILYDGPDTETAPPIYVVDEPMSNGANAQWIETMHPGVGAALAAWLDSAADDAEQIGPDHHALAVARQINARTP
ncbi:hypothetical protein ACIRQP_14865 [Streptomyces sp. NPDC102274]|uniref:hypothetical protein n=1 Tax=Streptomyces sp. NPDC102274 TaxID=3366151 RepID=UPI00381756A1